MIFTIFSGLYHNFMHANHSAMNLRLSYLLCSLCLISTCLPCHAQISAQKKMFNSSGNADFRSNELYNKPIDFENIDYARMNVVIFHLTNEIRAKHHLPVLEYAVQLENSATMHAQDMLRDKFFSHTNPYHKNRKTPNDRALLCNIANPMLAENIIEGYGLQYKAFETVYLRGKGKFSNTPEGDLLHPHTYLSFGESLLTGWMNSRDHRKNILSAEAVQLGCGVAYYTDPDFNDMPSFKAVQNFQWYKPIITTKQ